MAFWIFKSNPDHYDIDARLRDPNPELTWRVTRYRKEIALGDQAFIWRARADGRGLVGMIAIDSDPDVMLELPSELPYASDSKNEPIVRVRARFVHRIHLIPSAQVRATPGLEELAMFHGVQNATNFAVSAAEGVILKQMVMDAPQIRV